MVSAADSYLHFLREFDWWQLSLLHQVWNKVWRAGRARPHRSVNQPSNGETADGARCLWVEFRVQRLRVHGRRYYPCKKILLAGKISGYSLAVMSVHTWSHVFTPSRMSRARVDKCNLMWLIWLSGQLNLIHFTPFRRSEVNAFPLNVIFHDSRMSPAQTAAHFSCVTMNTNEKVGLAVCLHTLTDHNTVWWNSRHWSRLQT